MTEFVKPMKLRAHDTEDMRVIAGVLQDALVPLSDVTYLKAEKRFVFVANRFRWETDSGPREQEAEAVRTPEPAHASGAGGEAAQDAAEAEDASFAEETPYERVNCGVCFDKVRSVQVRNIDMSRKDQILNLLTVAAADNAIALHFSDGGVIRLEVSAYRCHLEDLGEPWPTSSRPHHPTDDTGADQA
ncbi:DUF2948 family protein [Denitrobaculum tricleocarpae]|uniref:DUF2948 family protein n=1 Tax=Denitrobaculum tricleocarpae TaxID=2591009 RepID=A0A545TB54_9PROT|nr:DUF2948 family protein [Denitrobaculum tricleocarpae]TQV74434.1 DUF2948 family protein [Denitrobaculum tricleocarpae]